MFFFLILSAANSSSIALFTIACTEQTVVLAKSCVQHTGVPYLTNDRKTAAGMLLSDASVLKCFENM